MKVINDEAMGVPVLSVQNIATPASFSEIKPSAAETPQCSI